MRWLAEFTTTSMSSSAGARPARASTSRALALGPPWRSATAAARSAARSSSSSRSASSDSARSRTIAGAIVPPAPRIATLIAASPALARRPSRDELPRAQGQPELDPIARAAEVAPRELLHAADPVAQGVAVAVELARGALPLAVLLDEGLERAHQLAPVGALALLDGRQDRVAEEPQGVVVLEREQQLERAEIAVGRQP